MSSLAPAPPPSGSPDTLPVQDAAAYLAGWWTVDRTLVDLRTGSCGVFRGTAEFRRLDDASLLHVEDGELSWNGAVNRAGRTLKLFPQADGTAEVTFADGRFFHDLDLRGGSWTTRHPCGQDLYDGTFTVASPAEWHVRWHTAGPAKDQLLRSVTGGRSGRKRPGP
ncbi:DUF6314 family protein, partial [Streptomyces sp. NPDC020667]|uniref:DUF6314 family protein n=1 Tax=Streptomyces sp. NPDC020667 TaxID=3154895 RepID=UPI0033FBAC7A